VFLRDNVATDGQLVISDMTWWVPAMRPSIEFGLKLDKELNSGMKTKLMWSKLQNIISPEFVSNIGAAGTTGSWRITSIGSKPTKVYIVFRHQNQYNSALSQLSNNPMVFQHMNITNINLRVNSLQFPQQEYEADFTVNNSWVRLYCAYLQCAGKYFDMEGGGVPISYDDFGTLYPIFCFDLSKQDPQIWANITTAELELRFRRSGELPAPNNVNYTIYAVIEFEKKIEISGADNRMRVIL